jgi:hypothetical protein
MEARPVIAVPGLTPRSPVMVVGPVEAVAGSSRIVETRTSGTATDPRSVDRFLRHLIAHLPGGFWSRGWGSLICSGWP